MGLDPTHPIVVALYEVSLKVSLKMQCTPSTSANYPCNYLPGWALIFWLIQWFKLGQTK